MDPHNIDTDRQIADDPLTRPEAADRGVTFPAHHRNHLKNNGLVAIFPLFLPMAPLLL